MVEEAPDSASSKQRRFSLDRSDIWIPVGLVAFTLLVRLLTLRGPSLGGDAMHTWFMSRVLTEGLTAEPWVWDHHTARLGVLGVSVAVQTLFGSHSLLYYLPALLMSCLQVVLLWKLGERLGAKTATLVAVAGLVLSPGMVRTGADLLPEVFAGTYLLVGLVLLFDHMESEEPGVWRLVGASLAFFAAYMAKLPAALALPGILAAMWFAHRRVRDMWLLLFIFLALVGLETLLYAVFTDFAGGRLHVIASTHLTHPKLRPISFWDLFLRFDATRMSVNLRHIFLAALIVAVALGFVRRAASRWTWTLALTIVSFVLGTTFAVKSIDPIVPALPWVERYFNPILPLLWLFVCVGFQELLTSQGVSLGWTAQRTRRVGYGLVALLLAWVLVDEGPGFQKRRTIPKLLEQRERVNEAFSNGMPIVSFRKDQRPVKAIRDILLRDYAELGYPTSAPAVFEGPKPNRFQYFALVDTHRTGDLADDSAIEEQIRAWQRARTPVLQVKKGPGRSLVIWQTSMDAVAPQVRTDSGS
jgi:hypothetical protein